MAYRDFKLSDLKIKFNLTQRSEKLFDVVPNIEPSQTLLLIIERSRKMRITTEKAVSEAIIMPVLSEIQIRNEDKLTLFSGENLLADKSLGLNGEVDFLIIREPQSYEVIAPIINVTEAKFNRAIENSIAQAAAQMMGARVFNQKHNCPYQTIYGCITNGSDWLFLKLEDNVLLVDTDKYVTRNLSELLGVLQNIIDFYKDIPETVQ
jgi:hypothetical protein